MGNVIQTDGPGKRRDKIMRLLATLIAQSNFQLMGAAETKDKTAFIYLSLMEIEKTIDETVQPWEKREYWVKADTFRKEWSWVKNLRELFFIKLSAKNWQSIDQEIELIKEKLSSVEPLKRIEHQEFWKGAYLTLNKKFLKK